MRSHLPTQTGQAYARISAEKCAKSTVRLLKTKWTDYPDDTKAMEYIDQQIDEKDADFVYHNAKHGTDENLFHSLASAGRASLIKRVAQKYDPNGYYINQNAGIGKGTPMLMAFKCARSKKQLPRLKDTLFAIIQLGGMVTDDVMNRIDSFANQDSKIVLFSRTEAAQLKKKLQNAREKYLQNQSTQARRNQSRDY